MFDILLYENGNSQYEGIIDDNGRKHGKGVLYYKDTGERAFKGTWYEDVFVKGIYYQSFLFEGEIMVVERYVKNPVRNLQREDFNTQDVYKAMKITAAGNWRWVPRKGSRSRNGSRKILK
jgi:hypothetical protein